MNNYSVSIFSLAAAALALAGCTSIPAGGVPVSAQALENTISGKTWIWRNGGPGAGAYFAPDKNLYTRYQGTNWQTTWYTRDGAFCYRHPEKDRCWVVYEKDGLTYSYSEWQPEFRTPYVWDVATELVSGRRVP